MAVTQVDEHTVEAFGRVEPGERPSTDPWVRPGTVEIDEQQRHRWILAGSGREVWPCPA